MAKPLLYMGNHAYSSWSLRAWWVLKMAGVDFDATVVPLEGAGGSEERKRSTTLAGYSPAAKVPVLKDGELLVWDSLAIIEYIAEQHPQVWPQQREARAVARSVSADIHDGVPGLGKQVVFNCRREPTVLEPAEDAKRDIDRLCRQWSLCRERYGSGGPFLFGELSAADAVASPLLLIFHTYSIGLPQDIREYQSAVLEHAAIVEWVKAAREEPWIIDAYETIG